MNANCLRYEAAHLLKNWAGLVGAEKGLGTNHFPGDQAGVDQLTIVPAIRQAIWSIDKNQPVWHVRTLKEIFDSQLTTPTESTALLGAFALLALLLASLGLYGVLSYSVAQRTAEIGVRMALGATPSEILLTIGKRGLMLTLAGLVIGLGFATVASRFLNTLLYGFRPDYVATVIGVSLILLSVATLACFIPARRASRVNPVITLRNEYLLSAYVIHMALPRDRTISTFGFRPMRVSRQEMSGNTPRR